MSENISYGAFHSPSTSSVSDKYLSIREYDLNDLPEVLVDIPEDSIVTKIMLIIDSVYDSGSSFKLVNDIDQVLFDSTWNDPTTEGAYYTELNYHSARGKGELCINNGLVGNGNGTLRIELYQTNNVYYQLLTSDDLVFTTADGTQIDIINKEG